VSVIMSYSMKENTTVSLTLRLPADLKQFIEHQAIKQDLDVSKYIRRLVRKEKQLRGRSK